MSSLGQLYLKKHLKEEQAQLEEAAREAEESQKKKGLFSAIGGFLGEYAAPILFGSMFGPAGLVGVKMLTGYAGREIGEALAGDSDAGNVDLKYGLMTKEKDQLLDSISQADKALNKQQFISSIANPVIKFGTKKLGDMVGEKLADTTIGKNITELIEGEGLVGKAVDKYRENNIKFELDPDSGELVPINNFNFPQFNFKINPFTGRLTSESPTYNPFTGEILKSGEFDPMTGKLTS